MDKFTALQTFIRVVDSGSFSKASDLLDMPKSTVTRLVQQLESELKVKLLHRTTRRLTVTQEGAAYYEGAVRLMESLSELDSGIALASATPQGKVKIEAPDWLATMAVIPSLPDFLARYPEIQLEIGINNRSIDLISENVDCVLRVGPLLSDSLIARHLGDLPLVTCASPDYLERQGMPSHPQDLAMEHSLVQVASPRTGRHFVYELSRDDDRIEIAGQHCISVNNANAALAAGLAGLGIVTTYAFLAQAHLDSGALVKVLPGWSSGSVPLHVAWPSNRHLANKVRVFVDWICETVAQRVIPQGKLRV